MIIDLLMDFLAGYGAGTIIVQLLKRFYWR